jgi:hypothetical protein
MIYNTHSYFIGIEFPHSFPQSLQVNGIAPDLFLTIIITYIPYHNSMTVRGL